MDSGTALQEFLEYVLSQLVSHPEATSISHEIGDNGKHYYHVRLAEEDIGRIIGRNGYTISSIRSLLDAAAARNNVKVSLKVYQTGGDKDGEMVA